MTTAKRRAADNYERVEVVSRAAWRDWLAANHSSSPGIWLVTYKKAEGERHLPYDAVVEEALCFGWIDSVRRRVDRRRSQLLLTPRKRGSDWSRANKQRVERLEAAGLIEPPGRAAIGAAKADGSWAALDDVENLIEPEDLSAALDADPDARRHWDAFPPSTRRGILAWIQAAKREATRNARVERTARLAAEGVRANEWRPPEQR